MTSDSGIERNTSRAHARPTMAPPVPPRRRFAAVLRWPRARRLVELFPLTPLGIVLGAAAYGTLELLAHAQLDLVWLVVCYAGLALLALSPLTVLSAWLVLKLHGAPPQAGDTWVLETGVPADTGFGLPFTWYMPWVHVSWEWLEPHGAVIEQRLARGRLTERAQLGLRGRFERIERRIAISDVFGLSRISMRWPSAQRLDVLPRLGGLRHLPALQAFASGDAIPHPMGLEDGDRLELRRYGSGDPARYIHWKVLARTRKLMVRTPERALSIARRTAAFLIAGDDDDASAGAARLALERRLLGQDWVFGTDDEPGGVDRLDAALDALMRSRAASERGGEAFAAFVQRVERGGPASLVLFAPSRTGAWLEHAAALARRRKLQVVIGIDAVHDAARPSWIQRVIASYRPPSGTPSAELDRVVRTLSEAGASVTVLDRSTGAALGAAHRRALSARVVGAVG